MFRPTSAEIQANRNRPHVSFHDVPRVISAENDEEFSLTNFPSYIVVPELSEESSFPVYQEIHEKRNTPPPPDEEDTEASTKSALWHRRVRGKAKITLVSSGDDQVS